MHPRSGTRRIGEFGMSLNRFAKRRDQNEPELVNLAKQLGWFMTPMDRPCDWLGLYNKRWYPIEIKQPFGSRGGQSHRSLNESQEQWHDAAKWYGGRVLIWRLAEDVLGTTEELNS